MRNLQETAKLALQLMDLTSLNDSDTEDTIRALCRQANCSFGGVTPGTTTTTAAVCVYPQFVKVAKETLKDQGTPEIQVATVANFPHGKEDIEKAVSETKAAIADGADEVDVVFPYQSLKNGNEVLGFQLVEQCKTECGAKILKVIIEVGELKTEELIRKASEISIQAGADFIKTSTGKVAVNATPESARVMLQVIQDLGVKDRVGFKAAGGVRSTEDASIYLDLADEIMGAGWIDARHFRFGASSLLGNLLKDLGHAADASASSQACY
jgi:deoxyribose-phosphate aldolase